MKLHLTKGLRAALLACVCVATSVYAAEEVTIDLTTGTYNESADITYYESDITGDDTNVTITGSGKVGLGDRNLADGVNGLSVNNSGTLTFAITGDTTTEIGAWPNSGASPTTIGSNVTNITFASGSVKLTCQSVIANSGSLTINNGASLILGSGTSTTLNGAITNNGTLSLDGGAITLANSALSKLTSATATGYSDGENGYYGTMTEYTLITGTGTTSGSATVSVDGTNHTLSSNGTFSIIAESDGIYYVNSGVVTTPDLGAATSVRVAAGATLKYEGDGYTRPITLAGKDSTFWMRGWSPATVFQVTLEGGEGVNHIIKGDQISVRTNVVGTGDLTLENTDETFYLKGEVNNVGSVTISGEVELQSEGGSAVGQFGSKVTEVIVGTGDTLIFNNGLTNTIDLALDGGAVTVTNGALTLGADSEVLSGTITVADGKTLDLTNVLTLGDATLDLGAGAIVKLSNTVELGALTLGEGVIFDVTAWKGFDALNEDLFTGVDTMVGAGENGLAVVTLKFADGTEGKAQLYLNNGVVSIPEPTTATLSLLALAGLAVRRRRK